MSSSSDSEAGARGPLPAGQVETARDQLRALLKRRSELEAKMESDIQSKATVFWAKAVPNGECLEFRGSRSGNGYRSFSVKSQRFAAHRVAWLLTYGPPGNIYVCHKCDNRLCVNPKHLFLGTHSQNMSDCRDKGRLRVPRILGANNPASKLTDDAVREIRREPYTFERGTALALKFGVHRATVRRIANRERWNHI